MVSGKNLSAQKLRLKNHIAHITSQVSEANELASSHPDQCLVKCRKVVELIAKRLCDENLTEDTSSWSLDRCVGSLAKNNLISRIIEANFRNVQKFGNIGAHESEGISLTEELVRPSIISLNFIVEWYQNEYHDSESLFERKSEEDVDFVKLCDS